MGLYILFHMDLDNSYNSYNSSSSFLDVGDMRHLQAIQDEMSDSAISAQDLWDQSVPPKKSQSLVEDVVFHRFP